MSFWHEGPYKPAGYEQKTVSSSSVTLASVPSNANFALIKVTGANVRYRDDGTDPTGSAGFPLAVDDILRYRGNPSSLEFIRDDASDATLEVLYYKVGTP